MSDEGHDHDGERWVHCGSCGDGGHDHDGERCGGSIVVAKWAMEEVITMVSVAVDVGCRTTGFSKRRV